MDTITQVLSEAAEKRDKAIRDAKREYRIAVQEIRSLRRRLGMHRQGRPRQDEYDRIIAGGNDSLHGMKVSEAVATILGEGKSLTLIELTLEVQKRGCRSRDDSRAVARAVRSSLQYHRKRFRRDRAGRWAAV